jgi:hypothetical protein
MCVQTLGAQHGGAVLDKNFAADDGYIFEDGTGAIANAERYTFHELR